LGSIGAADGHVFGPDVFSDSRQTIRVAPGLILMVLAWIGGVLFFGIAVLMAQTKL